MHCMLKLGYACGRACALTMFMCTSGSSLCRFWGSRCLVCPAWTTPAINAHNMRHLIICTDTDTSAQELKHRHCGWSFAGKPGYGMCVYCPHRSPWLYGCFSPCHLYWFHLRFARWLTLCSSSFCIHPLLDPVREKFSMSRRLDFFFSKLTNHILAVWTKSTLNMSTLNIEFTANRLTSRRHTAAPNDLWLLSSSESDHVNGEVHDRKFKLQLSWSRKKNKKTIRQSLSKVYISVVFR